MAIGKITVEIPVDDIRTLQAVLAAMGGVAPVPIPAPNPVPPPTPTPAPGPVDVNVYPLTMAPVVIPGDPVNLGTGTGGVIYCAKPGITLDVTGTKYTGGEFGQI